MLGNLFAAASLLLATLFAQPCLAGRPPISPALDGSLPSSLQIFVDQLASPEIRHEHRQYHSATDLLDHNAHHRLTSYLFSDGHDYYPHLLYLGRDPEEPIKHLAVAHFQPNEELVDRVIPYGSRMKNYKQRQGMLAMKPTSHEEPEFVGILWHSHAKTARKMKLLIDQNDLGKLESNEHIGLKDVQRVIHRGPV